MTTSQAQYLVDEAGKRTAVLLPLKEYQRLLEDMRDLAVVAERRNEDSIGIDEMRRWLRSNGHVPASD